MTVERPEPRGARCPRCESPVAGDYKFCPTCAFRLRAGVLDPAPAAPPSPPRRGRLFLAGLAGALLVTAIVAVGVALGRPAWFPRTIGPSNPREDERELDRAYTVADIPGQLIPLEPFGYAYSVPLSTVAGLTEAQREKYADALRSNGQVLRGEPTLDALIDYKFSILRIEVTRGMYEEFLRDVDEHRARIPQVWLEWDGKASATEIDILAHVPPAWIRSTNPSAPEWGVDEIEKNLPVAQVSYVDAVGFCIWAGHRLGLVINLPYMMEWVRAARPPLSAALENGEEISSTWPWGATNIRHTYACNSLSSWLPNTGWARRVDWSRYEEGGGATVNRVLCMAGNVREWTVIHDDHVVERRVLDQPPYLMWTQTPQSRRSRTARAYGGSFRTGIDDCQVDSHTEYLKTDRRDDLGFRIVAW